MGAVIRYRSIKVIARWALAALLFAQVALVANACLLDTGGRASSNMTQMVDCELAAANPSTCFSQYLDQNEQIGAQPPFVHPAANAVFLLVSASLEPVVKDFELLTPRGCDPPIPIRYCSLLN